MKEIFKSFYGKEVKSFRFNQHISVYPKQYKDGEIYETEVDTEEPTYTIYFDDGTEISVELSELLLTLFNLCKNETKNIPR
jgi:hypothetical protein